MNSDSLAGPMRKRAEMAIMASSAGPRPKSEWSCVLLVLLLPLDGMMAALLLLFWLGLNGRCSDVDGWSCRDEDVIGVMKADNDDGPDRRKMERKRTGDGRYFVMVMVLLLRYIILLLNRSFCLLFLWLMIAN